MPLTQSTSGQAPATLNADDDSTSRTATRASQSGGKIWNYAKSRFDKENWFGSAILIESWIAGYNKLRGSLVRQVHGQDQPDRIRALGYGIPLLGYTWSFFSKRGAKFPDGDTVPERMTDALHHPQESSNQFEFLIFLPGNIVSIINNVQKGLKAYGVGLKEGEKAYAPEKARLYMGVLASAWQACVGYGHFRKHSEAPQEDNKPVRHGFIGTIQKVWCHDRVLFIGSVINMTFPLYRSWKAKIKSVPAAKRRAAY
ncbi:MAG TPA: hypothetical protein VFT64_08590 [Rickettsiales bacterium]|nr:hypothetical protein [Rickettsiales bacterium]